MTSQDLAAYFEGKQLYGDDFSAEEIAAWFRDEAEGYAGLGAGDESQYAYAYHAWNALHGARHLPNQAFRRVLGFGAAYGDELAPWIEGASHVTIVDPSEAFARHTVHGKPASYVRPMPDGRLPLPDASFDLATCLGVLHHIPNVSFVLTELARVLAPGAWMLLREPIVSMGDWRHPRRGLTKRERGIPLPILTRAIGDAGLRIHRSTLCAFPLTPRLFKPLRSDPYNSRLAVSIDALLCRLFERNINYHPRNHWQRLRPTSAYLVLQKTGR